MKKVTRVEAVSTQEARDMSSRLFMEEGIMGGISTEANVTEALRVARDLGPGKKIVTLAPDSCTRYFSTTLFREPLKKY